ncbi:hypothetical protein D3Z52_16615 [Clostridiaceae bacterium]|nr:hypothetical protein [Clostridiaceae bacterium]
MNPLPVTSRPPHALFCVLPANRPGWQDLSYCYHFNTYPVVLQDILAENAARKPLNCAKKRAAILRRALFLVLVIGSAQ